MLHNGVVCKVCLIMNECERNHSMGSPMDGTPPRSEDLIEFGRSKTILPLPTEDL